MDSYKKLLKPIVLILLLLLFAVSCTENMNEISKVETGSDLLLSERYDLVKNKNLGIITNHTGVLSNGTHIVDTLHSKKDAVIVGLFGPEHGIRGEAPDGESIMSGFDSKTGLPVYSLYGKTRQPTEEMLKNVELLIFDIQDVGARFYTFISTMYYGIKAAAEKDIPIIILDRPNPINGIDVQGPILNPKLKSFVGIAEIPIRHGMTVGELAIYFNQTDILQTTKTADLEVVKMKSWSRDFFYDDTNLKWIKPSPNMPTLETAIVYPGLCLLEGTNISEGRGTYSPFITFGSPFINSNEVIKELSNLSINGCELNAIQINPIEIPNMSKFPKYKDQECNGIRIKLTDRTQFHPIEFAIKLIYVFYKLYPQNFSFREKGMDRLWGNSELREAILRGVSPENIIEGYHKDLESFKLIRKKHLLY